MDETRVSVAMATYNGEKYIETQIDSILDNLKENDELIVSDDGSTDRTIELIKLYQKKDDRVKLINGPHKGIKKNFENAITNCKGQYIFLSDQDDIWYSNKVETVLKKFKENSNITLVVHDAEIFDSDTGQILYESFFKYRNSGAGVLKNIYKNTYIGCCMAFKNKIKEKIIPIPNNIEMHDQWIGIINDLKFVKAYFLNEKLIKYRRHNSNVSQMKHYTMKRMIKNRIILIYEIIKRNRRR